jgi:hypothetical protein
MTFLEQLGWFVPCSEWENHLEQTKTEWGDTKLYAGFIAGLAMKEYMDDDRGASVEPVVDRVVRAGGVRLRDADEKRKNGVESLANEDKMRVHSMVHPPTKAAFASFAKEHTDDSPGVVLAYALREYWDGGRWARVGDKFNRVADDAEALLSEVSSSGSGSGSKLGTKEKRTIAIVRNLSERLSWEAPAPISRADIHDSIEAVTGSDSEYMLEQYTGRVIDRLDYEPHPITGSKLYVPSEAAEEQRRKEAEREAAEEMATIMVATDGGRDE